MVELKNATYESIRGFNYQPSNGMNGLQVWERFTPQLYRIELSRGKTFFPGINTVRIWLSMDAWLSDRERYLSNLATAAGILAELELRAIPVVFNGWFGLPSFGGLVPELIVPHKNRTVYRQYVRDVVAAVMPQRDAILIWDLCNEPFNNARDTGSRQLWGGFLLEMRDAVREVDNGALCTVGTQWAHDAAVQESGIAEWVDAFSLHPYFRTSWCSTPEALQTSLDESIQVINRTGKPALVTECCWGSLEDGERVESIKVSLRAYNERRLGFLPHLLHHTLVADGHRPEFGPIGPAGYMAFIEADGTLRTGHEVFNEF
ncbi:MAG: glycoside hydrolase family 5 protein [Candidatus Pacebacteria bacterium]|nr:glycoside hydrolase family 5 protein [Candidatus Paceibacterota bacterium]